MASALEFYANAFDAESLYGLRMIISWISVAVFIWLLSLSYLVWKADSKSNENRFMGVLLIIEGIKAAFLLPDAFPYDSDWEWLWNYLWVFKIEVFFYAHTAAILLYLCLPIYYRIEKLNFMFNPTLQKHAWYLAPLISLVDLLRSGCRADPSGVVGIRPTVHDRNRRTNRYVHGVL